MSHPGYRLDCQVNFAAEFHRRNDIVVDENRVRMGGVGGWSGRVEDMFTKELHG